MPFPPDHPLMVPNPTPSTRLPPTAPREQPPQASRPLAPHPTGVELAERAGLLPKRPGGPGNNHGQRGTGKRRAAMLSSAHLAMWLRENVPSSEIAAFLGGIMRGVDIYAPQAAAGPDGVPVSVAVDRPTIAERMAAAKLMLDRQLGGLEEAAALNQMVRQLEQQAREDRPNIAALDDDELATYRELQRKMLGLDRTGAATPTVVSAEDAADALESAKRG